MALAHRREWPKPTSEGWKRDGGKIASVLPRHIAQNETDKRKSQSECINKSTWRGGNRLKRGRAARSDRAAAKKFTLKGFVIDFVKNRFQPAPAFASLTQAVIIHAVHLAHP